MSLTIFICSFKPVTHEQVFFDKFNLFGVWTNEKVFFDKYSLQPAIQLHSGTTIFLDKFSLSTHTDEQVLQCAKFFLDKYTCSKASILAFEQVHLSRKNLTSFSLHTSK